MADCISCDFFYRTSDAPQPLDPHDPNSLLANAGNNGNGSGSGTYKPGAASPAPQMQHSNSYNMVPVQAYSPGLNPNVDQQRLSGTPGGGVSGPYPSYQQPYGQA